MKNNLFFKRIKLAFVEAMAATCGCMFLTVPFLGSGFGAGNHYYEVTLEGNVVGSVKDPSVVEQAFLDARARISKETDGLVLSDVECSTRKVEKIFGSTLETDALTDAIYEELHKDVVTARKKAYLLKIDGFTLTVGSYQDVLEILNATKNKFDLEDEFEVNIVSETERELNIYTAQVKHREEPGAEEESSGNTSHSLSSVFPQAGIAAYDLSPLVKDIITATVTEELIEEEENEPEDDLTQVMGDGLRVLKFSEKVEIAEAYVNEEQITPVETAIDMVTKDTEKNQVYEVQAGDSLSVIANSRGLLVKDVLALNEGLTAETVLHIGDEIIITVPEPELSVITTEETTYEEDYYAETEYILNDDWYTTQTVVRQEAAVGHHEVTMLITRKNNTETERQMIAETVMVEPVAQVIEKGTKTPPTYIKPLSGGRQTSGFKMRWGRMHRGVDWACPVGTSIMASCGGTVVQAGWYSTYGNCVTLQHPDGRQTRYAHLSKILVSTGQKVSQGQKIALSGNTGRSTGPHVHFEIIINGTRVNPLKYLN